ncbi:MAG: molybdopterin molybdotransferase MoeA [Deltaproteobacteria bacterium]|nr:molybdopterin molybdotransferase MoeA [Deltaproteobacteria bacterium]MBW2414951.1 molybdopterin molybdotransferase MoeA [Deltaproteobacteria bacterium]
MRGFAQRMDVEEVERLLRARLAQVGPDGGSGAPLGAEPVPLLEAAGRVLAEAVEAGVDVPGFDRSAMDGYAVRGEDTFGATDYGPLTLDVVGESYPGRPFDGTVAPGQAVRIMTGAPVPQGADAVVMAEVCQEKQGRVEVRDAVSPRKHVGPAGEDIRCGDLVLREGRRLRPQDVGLLASIGVPSVACVRRPRVRLLVTGDELVRPGEAPGGARIADSNSPMLRALIGRDGGEVSVEHLPDRRERIRAALEAPGADVILVSGGSSVGQEDHAPGLVAELGSLDFHGVAMRPSSPAGGGRVGEAHVFLLPGNPVSCLCAYEFFAGPSIRTLGGRAWRWPHARVRLPLLRKISSQVGRTDYVRVGIEGGKVVPIATSGASILSSTVRAAGAVIVPRELEGMAEGVQVEVLLYGGVDELDLPAVSGAENAG